MVVVACLSDLFISGSVSPNILVSTFSADDLYAKRVASPTNAAIGAP